MKQEDWTKRLRDRLADHEEPAPVDLWADIEARLKEEGIVKTSEPETPKRPARLVPLWGKRIAVAAAFIGVLTCNGYLMWELGQEEKARRSELTAMETSNSPKESAKSEQDTKDVASEEDVISQEHQGEYFMTHAVAGSTQPIAMHQEMTPETDAIQSFGEPEVLPTEEKTPVSSEKPVQEAPSKILPSEEEQLRQLDLKIAEATKEATKKQKRGRIGFSLYAQGGSGNEMNANGVMMSPQLAESYNYQDQLVTRHQTRSSGEIIYLVDYQEQQKHYQPISFGLTTNIPISSRFSLTTGLVYTRLRSDFVSIMAKIPLTKEQTLHYLGIPLTAQYLLWQWKGLKVYASAGGQADYNVKAHMEQQGVDYPAFRDRWQFSIQGAVGIEYDVIPQLGLYVEPGVKRYFNNGSRVDTYFKDRPTSFNLQIGLRLNLGKFGAGVRPGN